MWHMVCHPLCQQPPQPHEHPDVPELGVAGHQHSPLLGVQVTAADSDGEEAGGAGGGAVAVQEAPDVEAEVSGAGQVVGVGADPADDLGRERGRRDGTSGDGVVALGTARGQQHSPRRGRCQRRRCPPSHHSSSLKGWMGQVTLRVLSVPRCPLPGDEPQLSPCPPHRSPLIISGAIQYGLPTTV